MGRRVAVVPGQIVTNSTEDTRRTARDSTPGVGPTIADGDAQGLTLARIPGLDLRSMPLGPQDGFLLSCVDDAGSLADLADVTGMTADEVTAAVARLVDLGVLEWRAAPTIERPPSRLPAANQPASGRPTPGPSASGRPTAGSSASRQPGPRSESTAPSGQIHTKPPPPGASRVLYDPEELEEDVDLDIGRRRQVLDTFYRLDEVSYYELLNITADADKAAVRTAYFSLSKVFHPDTMFRKRLGTYKAKMETIFHRLTEAYDALGKKRTRAAYDEYLAIRAQTEGVRASLAEGEREAAAIAREVEQLAAAAIIEPQGTGAASHRAHGATAAIAAEASGATTQPTPEADRGPARVEPSSSPTPRPRLSPQESKQQAREMMARKLAHATGRDLPGAGPGGSGMPPSPRGSKAPIASTAPIAAASEPPAGDGAPEGAAPHRTSPRPPANRDVLLRGLASSIRQAAAHAQEGDRAQRYLDAARRCEADGDLVKAANALKMAIAIEPGRRDLRQHQERVGALLAEQLAATYEVQARYEQGLKQFGKAATSWLKACEGRPRDGRTHAECAIALLAAGQHAEAHSYARRAVALGPDEVLAHAALGRACMAMRLTKDAQIALADALKLDPNHEMVENLRAELGGATTAST